MYEKLKSMIDEAENIVCLAGSPLIEEAGYPYIRDVDCAYDVEERYGYSPEELFNTVMLSTRPELFFKYYKKEVLEAHVDMRPSPTFYALAKLERLGKLSCTITRSIYGQARMGGCRNVIELRGNIMNNRCQKCGREYSKEYIRTRKGIPQCLKCAGVVRPELILNGEMIDNDNMTRAAKKVSEADVLLVLGTTLKSDLTNRLVQYYEGSNLVVINKVPHYSDRIADYFINERPMDVLPRIL